MNVSRPTTHICRQVFCATIEFSISVVMNNDERHGRKQPSPTTLNISTQPCDTVTLLPILQLSITAPGWITTLSPSVTGPRITADGSM